MFDSPPASLKPRFSDGDMAPCVVMLYRVSVLKQALVGQSPVCMSIVGIIHVVCFL